MIKPVVLVVLDGWGLAAQTAGNPIAQAKLPTMERLKNFPHSQLLASGTAVGLLDNDPGNTEIGHVSLAAGRVSKTPIVRITEAIKNGSFFTNKALLQATDYVKKYHSNLHLMGLLGSGNVHASNDYLYALLKLAKQEEVENVFLHLFTDGRDSSPTAALSLVNDLQKHLVQLGSGTIATITGRFFAMDRDRRWSRTKKAYEAVLGGVGEKFTSTSDLINSWYQKNITDEFIPPSVVTHKNGNPLVKIGEHDSVIFYNHRIDRAKQLTAMLTNNNKHSLKLFFVSMVEYDKHLPVQAVAFPPEPLRETLGEIFAQKGLSQLRAAESEKERFVTYYFNGYQEQPFDSEDRLIVPSPQVNTYDEKPAMSAFELTEQVLVKMEDDNYDFILINFANPDMVGHTGLFKPTVEACEAVDTCLGKILDKILQTKTGLLIVTADHGNAEEKIDLKTGVTLTEHTSNPVPIIFAGSTVKEKQILSGGILADVAPTLLNLLNIKTPSVMTGKNLLS